MKEQNYDKPSFKKLIDKLQEESWQLELLISGFAIFGLFYAYSPLETINREALNDKEMLIFFGSMIVLVSISILIFNLLLHVILRGLWIGALGLRYVSGDIDYKKLNYSQKFTSYLKREVGSFDDYIGKLENLCSVIFAISFLLIFYVLAFAVVILTIVGIATYFIDNDNLANWISKGVGIPLMIFVVTGMFLTFFDFVTQGLLKKKQWVSKIYFPFYWVFSFLTLSFLYRPLVYNFLDNKYGKRVSFILIPFYILIMIFTSFSYQKSNILEVNYQDQMFSNEITVNDRNYEDLINKNNVFIDNFAIQSKVITEPYLKVIFSFSDGIENRIFKFNKSLKPKKDRRGLQSDMQFGSNKFNKIKQDSLRVEYLNTFNKIYNIKIDSLHYPTDFVFTKNEDDIYGFETFIKIKHLNEGKHIVNFVRLKHKDTDSLVSMRKIPFWYFKD